MNKDLSDRELPDLEFLDLDEDTISSQEDGETDITSSEGLTSDDMATDSPVGEQEQRLYKRILHSLQSIYRKVRPHINSHIVFAAVAVLIVLCTYISIVKWGVFVDLDEIFKDGEGTYEDTLDSILPLMYEGENPAVDGITKIVCFGNSPFADDRDSKDNLANIIAQETNATVYNCSIGDSFLSCALERFNAEVAPLDAYSLYMLCGLTIPETRFDEFAYASAECLGDNVPSEAAEVVQTLLSIDFNTVDVVAIMYDASDYLDGRPMYSDENNTSITQFTGNLEASIELFKNFYPHIRVIVMSPTFAYAPDGEGDYISSDIATFGWDVLSTYVIKEADSSAYQSASFVDNFYGTITEENAKDYLKDHLHLNVAGRKKVAERFVYALNYFNE